LLSNHYNLQAPVGVQFTAVVCGVGEGGRVPGKKACSEYTLSYAYLKKVQQYAL